jgi:hypothetical protein
MNTCDIVNVMTKYLTCSYLLIQLCQFHRKQATFHMHSTWVTSWLLWNYTIYNYCLHTMWTSKVVNPRVVIFSESPIENNLWRVDNFRCSAHMKAITVLLYRSYSKLFIAWMVCFAEDNKIMSRIDNTITEPDWKKNTRIFNTLPVAQGYRQDSNLLSSSVL